MAVKRSRLWRKKYSFESFSDLERTVKNYKDFKKIAEKYNVPIVTATQVPIKRGLFFGNEIQLPKTYIFVMDYMDTIT